MQSTSLVTTAAPSLPSRTTWKPSGLKPQPTSPGCQVTAVQAMSDTPEGQSPERLLVLDVVRLEGDSLVCVNAASVRNANLHECLRAAADGRRLQPDGEITVPVSSVLTVVPPAAESVDEALGYIATVTGAGDMALLRSAACWAARIESVATYEGREFEVEEGDELLVRGLNLLLESVGPYNRSLSLHVGDVDRDFYDAGFVARSLGEEAVVRFTFEECIDSEGDSEHTHIIELPDCIVRVSVSLGHYSDENWDGSILVDFGGGSDPTERERFIDSCVLGSVNKVASRFAEMIRQLDPRQRGLAIQQIARLTRDLDVQMPANDDAPAAAALSA